jgi:hemolysin activation/secretion protein
MWAADAGSFRARWAPRTLHCGLLAAALVVAGHAQAQPAPSAGTILNGVERTTPPTAAPPAPTTALRPEPAPDSFLRQGQTAHVTRFQILASRFPERDLQALVSAYVGRDCTLGDLQEASARITHYYRRRGYLARAYLPQQTAVDGVITIVVVEARLGRVTIDPASKARLDGDVARGIVLAQQPAGAAIRFSALERGLANIAALPALTAVGALEPGDSEGLTDLRLKLVEAPVVSGVAIVDNDAERSLGTWRALGVVSVNDLLGRGEQATITAMKSSGSLYGRLELGAPLGASGLRAGVDLSGLSYRVDADYNAATPDGWAATAGAWLRAPLVRDETAAFDGLLSYEHKRLVNRTAQTVTGISVLDEVSASVSGSLRDNLLGHGVDLLSLTLTAGSVDLSSDPSNLAADRLTARTEGGFAKLVFSADHAQSLGRALDWRLHVDGQIASTNLDSSELFSLGGPDGVRAYPVDEAEGADGVLARIELGWRVVPTVRIAPFLEAGLIRQYVHTWAGWNNGGVADGYGLYGGGLAMRWTINSRLNLDVTGAQTLGDNPGRINGYDADGARAQERVWVRLSAAF